MSGSNVGWLQAICIVELHVQTFNLNLQNSTTGSEGENLVEK